MWRLVVVWGGVGVSKRELAFVAEWVGAAACVCGGSPKPTGDCKWGKAKARCPRAAF